MKNERRERQIEQNRTIGDDASDPALPTILTLDEMRRDFVYIGSSGAIVHMPTRRIRKKENAATEYAASKTTIETDDINSNGTAKTKTVKTINLWLESPERTTVDVLTWWPGQSTICKPPEADGYGSRAFNTWKDFTPPAVPDDWQRRVLPFFQHVAYLVPIEPERDRFLQWLAHIFQKPNELPHTCYLFVAEQTGIGRNTLASIIIRALRGHVAANVNIGKMLDGSFNGRLSRKLLATVDETREGMGERRYQRANAFRSIITEEIRHINPKYGVESVEVNCCRWLMFSNHFDAIPFENTDRRVIVIENPTIRLQPDWFEFLHNEMKDHVFIAAIQHYLLMLDISSFKAGEHAPMNGAKAKALNAQSSVADKAAKEFAATWPGSLATTNDLKAFIRSQLDGEPEPSGAALRYIMQRAGIVSADRSLHVGTALKERIIILRAHSPETVKDADPSALKNEITDARSRFDAHKR